MARRGGVAARGTSEGRFTLEGDELLNRVKDTVIFALGQKRMFNYRLAGIAHLMVYGAFVILLLRAIVLWGRGYDPTFDFWGVLALDNPLGVAYSLAKEAIEFGCILGCGVFFYYRTVSRPKRMTLGAEVCSLSA